MITALKGKKETPLSREELIALTAGYKRVCLDIGTGDGKNVYRKALSDPETFYIGLDPVKENMEDIAVKLTKKPEKGGLPNVLLVVASAEKMPPELYETADKVTVLFPWGALLEGVIKPLEEFLAAFYSAAKPGAEFEFITTYSDSYEEATIGSRRLPELTSEYLKGEYTAALKKHRLEITDITEYDNEFVKGFDSKWAKRLAFGRKRKFFDISGKFNK